MTYSLGPMVDKPHIATDIPCCGGDGQHGLVPEVDPGSNPAAGRGRKLSRTFINGREGPAAELDADSVVC